jgi:FkbM family methyltransferase
VAIDVPLSDAYWAAAGINGTYEVELFRFFDCLPPHTTLFVDCGANIGWWSLLAEKRWGWDCVAIEASGALVARLERARNANAAHFTIFHKAVWNRDGELLSFRTGDGAHAAGHIAGVTGFVSPRRVPDVERVESITVDTILAQRTRAAFDRVIVKLDVEGAELQAIEGAKRTIAEGALVIYEDHGSDRRCRPTAMLLEMGLNVYTLEPALMRIGKLEDAARLKRNPRKGYNFLACSAPAPESL